MELVFVLLAVVMLVVLPVAFLLFVAGGLVYAIGRAIRGGKREDMVPSPTGMRASRNHPVEPVAVRVTSPNRNRGA